VKKYRRIAVVLLIGLLNGCEEEGPEIDVESAIPVGVESVALKPIREFVFATGTVHATKNAELKVEQGGYYRLESNPRTGKPFAMSDPVKKGDLIVSFDNPEFENSVQLRSKKINYDVSEREYNKQKSLYDKGGVTLRELTDAEQAFINAGYSYDNAVLQLEKLRFVAPFDGMLVDLTYFSPGQKVEAGATVAQVMDYRKLYAAVSLPGKEMGRVEVGQPVQVFNYAYPEDTLSGAVTQVSPALDPESRTFKVNVLVDNDSLILRPGMFVKIDIVVAEKAEAIVIPKDIILDKRRGKTVFVVQKGVALERQIDIGLSNPTEVEVISGLEADERLVVRGYETLRDRSKIKVIK
jgi:RND family efflux transporter MFP subunit